MTRNKNANSKFNIYNCLIAEEMQEVLLYFPQVRDIRPSAQIEDIHMIKDIAAKCGYKVRTVAPPSAEEKQEIVSRIECFLF